jgi:Ran GTPase-activating protein (RanGAP) involved in mRNA processing and transport
MRNLATTRILQTIRLAGLTFDDRGFRQIAHGLLMNKTIKMVALSKITFLAGSFPLLAESFASHALVDSLELSNDALGEFHEKYILSIITKQANKRNEAVWMKGLRGNKIEANDILGLTQLNLSNNRLGNSFAKSLYTLLLTDEYLKLLNLSGNSIEKEGCELIVNAAKVNKIIVNFDIRGNPGFQEKFVRPISEYLSRNIRFHCKNYEVKFSIRNVGKCLKKTISIKL